MITKQAFIDTIKATPSLSRWMSAGNVVIQVASKAIANEQAARLKAEGLTILSVNTVLGADGITNIVVFTPKFS